MSRRYFGTDGIRGRVGHSPITADFMLRLGHAVGQVLRRESISPTVVIGKDTRISGYMIESALEAGFVSAGVNVRLSGPIPTPAVAYLARALRLDLGVVISASHNPFGDNGVKFFSGTGQKLSDAWERAVEAALEEEPVWADSARLGKARRIDDAGGRYVEFCKSTVGSHLTLRGMKIAVDAAHGAAYQVAPEVFHELGAEVVRVGCMPDGVNINAGVGATAPEALIRAVKDQRADYGVALDGDADRLVMVDSTGRVYNGDELLFLMAIDRQAQGQGVPGVVGTLMTNLAVDRALQRRGIELVRAKVGDRYVLEELLARNWVLGGEGSGHLLALDRHTTGDGIVSALQVLNALQRSSNTMAAALSEIALFPQVLVNVAWPAGRPWQGHGPLVQAQAEVAQELGDRGRILIRASGTEPVLRLMVEAEEAALAQRAAQHLAKAAGLADEAKPAHA